MTSLGFHNSEINHSSVSPRMGCLEYSYLRPKNMVLGEKIAKFVHLNRPFHSLMWRNKEIAQIPNEIVEHDMPRYIILKKMTSRVGFEPATSHRTVPVILLMLLSSSLHVEAMWRLTSMGIDYSCT